MSYNYLSLQERHYIEIETKKGRSMNKIAIALERSQSSISREIERNTGSRGFGINKLIALLYNVM